MFYVFLAILKWLLKRCDEISYKNFPLSNDQFTNQTHTLFGKFHVAPIMGFM